MMKELEKSVVSVGHLSRLPSQVMERGTGRPSQDPAALGVNAMGFVSQKHSQVCFTRK